VPSGPVYSVLDHVKRPIPFRGQELVTGSLGCPPIEVKSLGWTREPLLKAE